ncbi:MAG: TlpA family protein disulfide reductase [Deltaproteobacteria bacterium]|nr:TlpA family protein disulfide reductase [Deltaproteobacteria bacterium]
MRRLAGFVLAVCLLLAGGPASGQVKDILGKPAPDFTGAAPFGPPVSIAQFRGKVPVVVTFWSIYCATCLDEMAALQRLFAKYGPGKVAVVAVNEDADVGVERVKAFLDRFASSPQGKFSYPILFDAKGGVLRAYGVSRLPTLVFVDRDGTVREFIEGFEPGRETAVLSAIEKLIAAVTPESLQGVESEVVYDLSTEAPLCGTYRDGKWYRPLDLDETRQDVVARARAEGEEALRREAVRLALLQLGVSLHSDERSTGCRAGYGVELRSQYRRKDALDRFAEKMNLPRVIGVEAQETIERDRDLSLYRQIRVHLPALREQLEQGGYSVRRSEIRIRFARATHFEEHNFVEALYSEYPFLSSVRRVTSELRGRDEYVLVSHATPEKAVESMRGMNVGARQLSVELVGGTIAEVSMWR